MRSFVILYSQVKYYYGDQIKEEWTRGAYVTNEEERKCVQYFVDETGMKEPLGRPRLRLEDNTKMGLMERLWEGVDCRLRWEDNIKMAFKERI